MTDTQKEKKSQTLDIVIFALFNIVLNESGLYRHPIVYDLIDVECPEYTDIEEVNWWLLRSRFLEGYNIARTEYTMTDIGNDQVGFQSMLIPKKWEYWEWGAV